ncbi:hypothetical protein [Pseudarthrobacter scleromae]|jgi:hypothetical protein|uniref:hypothetical protein n=1 Tax=Pseudarthrobacter scleromae TaxID=158897 RepID=UPI003CFDC0F8
MHYDITRDGKVLGVPVLDVQELPGDDSAIVLLDYMTMGKGPQRNLVKVRNDGSIAWIADLPDTGPQECYVSMDLGPAGIVFANTWLGYRVSIDAGTGRILGKTFTK